MTRTSATQFDNVGVVERFEWVKSRKASELRHLRSKNFRVSQKISNLSKIWCQNTEKLAKHCTKKGFFSDTIRQSHHQLCQLLDFHFPHAFPLLIFLLFITGNCLISDSSPAQDAIQFGVEFHRENGRLWRVLGLCCNPRRAYSKRMRLGLTLLD